MLTTNRSCCSCPHNISSVIYWRSVALCIYYYLPAGFRFSEVWTSFLRILHPLSRGIISVVFNNKLCALRICHFERTILHSMGAYCLLDSCLWTENPINNVPCKIFVHWKNIKDDPLNCTEVGRACFTICYSFQINYTLRVRSASKTQKNVLGTKSDKFG